jgi:hypothetical protein
MLFVDEGRCYPCMNRWHAKISVSSGPPINLYLHRDEVGESLIVELRLRGHL